MARRVPTVLQLTPTECGVSCVQMVLGFYGRTESASQLRRAFDVGRDGTSMTDLAAMLEERGYSTRIGATDAAALHVGTGPVILFWAQSHFVVWVRSTSRFVVIVDPARGRIRIGRDEFERLYSGIALHVAPGAAAPMAARAKEPASTPRIGDLSGLRDNGLSAALFALVALVSITFAALPPALAYLLVDSAAGSGTAIEPSSFIAALAIGALLSIAVLIARSLVLGALAARLSRRLSASVFQHLLTLPYRYFATRAPQELLYRLTGINAVRDLLATEIANGVFGAGVAIALIGYLLAVDARVGLWAVGAFVLVIALLAATRPAVRTALDNEIADTTAAQAIQADALSSIRSVKLGGLERRVMTRWRDAYDVSLRRMRRRQGLQGSVAAVVVTVQAAAPLIVLYTGLRRLEEGGSATMGSVIAMLVASILLVGSAPGLYGAFSRLVTARSYGARVSDIVEERPARIFGGQLQQPTSDDISVDHVSFSYTARSAKVLDDVSFDVPAGAKVAIVGPSGSGKSTIGNLLAGLYEPTAGIIRYGGDPLSRFDEAAFRMAVGYVPQDSELLDLSVIDNITLGDDDLDESDATRAAQAALVHDEIETWPMGYRTLLSARGSNISGGQRQRIALARAIARRPRVLILDEATSALDQQNSLAVIRNIDSGRSTRVIIAHRLSSIVDADLILVMDGGRIVERGTHDSLMENGELYPQLYRQQIADG